MAKTLSQMSGMPQMAAAFSNWMVSITISIISQAVIDGFVQDTPTNVTFKGTVQPLDPELVALKPDGQRSWQWLQIHCFAGSLNLVTNDRLLYNGKKYKVMAVLDYSLNNYVEYHIILDYQDQTA